MYRSALLGSLLLVTALTGCGDDTGEATATTSGGEGGEAGSGGNEPATTSTATGDTSSSVSASQSASSVGGGSSASSTGGAGGDPGSGGASGTGGETGQGGTGGAGGATGSGGSAGSGGAPACDSGTPSECAAEWEQNTANRYDELVGGNQNDLANFLFAVPKGGDLHNHLTGAVYAETLLDLAVDDGGYCIDPTLRAITSGSCNGANQDVPPPNDPFYDEIVRAWSMKDFDYAGAVSGHDHFFSTFGKFGGLAGVHRNENLGDIAMRAANENQVYIETMFNLGKNIGDVSGDNWSGTLNIGDLEELYDSVIADGLFETELQKDVNVVDQAYTQYRQALGCSGGNQPAACDVGMRFIAQVSRTGTRDIVFGQLISAFEMAARTPWLVGVNLSSPEDDTTSINAYNLHMAMLDLLYEKYTVTGLSPLRVTLHAGELTPEFAPPAALAFHVRAAVLTGHAVRIGHGLDILGEDNSADTLAVMRDRKVLVETCLSSNIQILGVDGDAHPLDAYIEADVPVAFATDDQGVSRSSMAGEYMRAAIAQEVSYRQLKKMARDSLEHAFLLGDSLWVSVGDADAVADCQPTSTMGLGEEPNGTCQSFLDDSERAQAQWELERRFRAFESQQ